MKPTYQPPDWQECYQMLSTIRAQLEAVSALLAFHSPAPLQRAQGMEIAHFIRMLVASRFGLSIEQLDSETRTERLVWPRHVAIFLCREFSNLSSSDVAEIFGNRDHGTILHACERVLALCTGNEIRRAMVMELKVQIQAHLQEEEKAA